MGMATLVYGALLSCGHVRWGALSAYEQEAVGDKLPRVGEKIDCYHCPTRGKAGVPRWVVDVVANRDEVADTVLADEAAKLAAAAEKLADTAVNA